MKKALLLSVLAISVIQLKAQHLFNTKPLDSLSNLFPNYLKSKPQTGLQFLSPEFRLSPTNNKNNFFANDLNYDHMPIVVLQGYDNMAIVKLNGDDHMPMLSLEPGGPIIEQRKGLPGMPTFSSPASKN